MTDQSGTDTIDVEVEVEDLARWRRRLALTIPAGVAGRIRDRHVRELARHARVKGFRPGKAPARLVEQRYSQEIEAEVLKDLIREGYAAGVTRRGLEPISPPHVHDVRWSPDGALTFTAEVDVRPEIELARTTGFRLEAPRHRVTGEDVERVLLRLREERADWLVVERAAGEGDLVVFDSVPLDADGAPRAHERVENHKVVLGHEALLPDFEAGLQGVSPGEEKTIRVGFPEDHPNEALRGTVREFRVSVSEVRERRLPELDDAFAAEIGRFESLDEAREKIRSNLGVEMEQQSLREVNETLIDEIISANEIDLPESMIDRYLANMLSDKDGPLSGRVPAERQEELVRVLRPGAERALRRHYILERVAEREALEATDEDVRTAGIEWSGDADDLKFHLTMERVFAWLRERSEITTVES